MFFAVLVWALVVASVDSVFTTVKTYIRTFSLREEWEALKTVKFYKDN